MSKSVKIQTNMPEYVEKLTEKTHEKGLKCFFAEYRFQNLT